MLYDSHAHLNNEGFNEQEREAFIARVQECVDAGVLK